MDTLRTASDVAFSPAVKRVQAERGSRAAYARMEREGGFRTSVDDDLREFLAGVDTAFLATASADGQPYVQHRGGPRGFLTAVDDTGAGPGANAIAFVDVVGNRQYVTTGNLTENDRVCLLLIDYATRQRVKVWGRARTVAWDEAWQARIPVASQGRPERVVVIDVTAWDVNCPKNIPQKLDAADVAPVIERYEARIAALEAEVRALRRGRG